MALPPGYSSPAQQLAGMAKPKPVANNPNRPPTNMLQAYGNMGGKLPGMTYTTLPSGFHSPGEWSYQGSHPVNLAQAYQNMGGKLPIPPAAKPGGPGQTPGTQAIDPRDATYYQNVAANQFKVNNSINAARLQESQTQTALQEALAQLAYQQPRSQLALEERANSQGGLYSSGYGQRQGDLLHTFTNRKTAAQTSANNSVNRLTAQIAALQGGVPIYNQGQYLAAALRASAAAAANPATGQPQAVPVGGGKTATKKTPPVENLVHRMVPVKTENITHKMKAK